MVAAPLAHRWKLVGAAVALIVAGSFTLPASAQQRLPWENPPANAYGQNDAYQPQQGGGYQGGYQGGGGYQQGGGYQGGGYQGGDGGYGQGQGQAYRPDDAYRPPAGGERYVAPPPGGHQQQAYEAEPRYRADPDYRLGPSYDRGYGPPPRYDGRPSGPPPYDDRSTYSSNEILHAGHGFFGSVSQGLASVVEHVFKKAGRPNGYILGEDAGGAFVAGLRYGEGTLYTKDAGTHKVYWQGPSIGYDFGGEGSKTMVLVYNLRHPHDIYNRFGGVQGSAYLVGGVSVQFQQNGNVTLAPIRSGVGLRLGANVGYLKYTRSPTWNPF